MEERSGSQMIQIGHDNAGDCSITSRDEPGWPEMDLSVMDMTFPACPKLVWQGKQQWAYDIPFSLSFAGGELGGK